VVVGVRCRRQFEPAGLVKQSICSLADCHMFAQARREGRRRRQYGLEAWPACRSTPGAGAHVKRFLTSSPGGTCIAWLPLRPDLHSTYAHRSIRIPHFPHSPATREPRANSKNAIYRRLLPGRLPFLQHRQCLPSRDVSSTSEPRPRPRLTSGSCHPFDAARNGIS
jgi:hypothetical protein